MLCWYFCVYIAYVLVIIPGTFVVCTIRHHWRHGRSLSFEAFVWYVCFAGWLTYTSLIVMVVVQELIP